MGVASKRATKDSFPLSREDNTKPQAISSLMRNTDEVAFERGGASALTPFELKKVANEAAGDVLFEREGLEDGESMETTPQRKKRRVARKAGAGPEVELENDSSSKTSSIHHINFKNLRPNSVLLGQIAEVNKTDLRVEFTDGLSGYVDLAHISSIFTTLLEDIEKSDEEQINDDGEEYVSSSDDDEATSKELPNLQDYFKIGQWLRCQVLSNSALDIDTKKNKKRRIEITIEPEVVNPINKEDLMKNYTIQCCVKSVEDHGATLDFGISGVTGFISNKDITNRELLKPGFVFLGNIGKVQERSIVINTNFRDKKNKIHEITNVDSIIPGQLMDFLCKEISAYGIIGTCLGLVPGYLTNMHARLFKEEDLKAKYAIGEKITCRIIGKIFNKDGEPSLLVSVLPHIITLDSEYQTTSALEAFPIGYIFDSCTYKGRSENFLYLELSEDIMGKVHSSKVGDVENGKFTKARVLGYDSLDCMYELSTDQKFLEYKYVRTNDIPAGEVLTGCEITDVSSSGIKLKIFGGQFKAFVPPLHISDTKLVYPERKYKIGSKVKARVLYIDFRGRVFVTLKKSLVNLNDEECCIITNFKTAQELKDKDKKTVATVQAFKPSGCVITFFGGLSGYLPNSEISEAYVRRPEDHLRLGQTVVVKLINVDVENNRILVTCNVSATDSENQKTEVEKLVLGRSMATVSVVEKTKDSVIVEIPDINIRGVIYVGHLSDDSLEKNRNLIKKIRIGQEMTGLVIDKDVRTRVINMSLKNSLINDAKDNRLPLAYKDITTKQPTDMVHGYVKSISEKGIFVAFNGKFVGLVLPSYAVDSKDIDITKKFYLNQSITAYVLRVDDINERFLLSLRAPKTPQKVVKDENTELKNPVDPSIKTVEDIKPGSVIEARIKGVKKNQLNIFLADNLHGRVSISEIFENIEDIADINQPLSAFKKDDKVNVKVIGSHDIKSHTFLPISHLATKGSVLELSMKPSTINSKDYVMKTTDTVKPGDELLAFVNNHSKSFSWLTISPNLKGKISAFHMPNSGKTFTTIEEAFPIGTAMNVRVTSIDTEHNIVNAVSTSHKEKNFDTINVGDILPARITKVLDKYMFFDLGNDIKGIAFVMDAVEDLSTKLREQYEGQVNDIVSAKVTFIDNDRQQIHLSLLSSDMKRKAVKSCIDLHPGEVVDALIKNVTDQGLYVYLNSDLQAFVPVSKLSDSYLKEWKTLYKPLRPVKGKVVNCEDDSRILLSLRDSEVNGELKIMKNYDDIKVGDIYTGTVKNVTDFGVFVKLDNTVNVTGLAHITEIADKTPEHLSDLFGTGDRVKAIVLKTNPKKKQLSLSLKASNFEDINDSTDDSDPVDGYSSAQEAIPEDADEVMHDVNQFDSKSDSEDIDMEDDNDQGVANQNEIIPSGGLSTGFDWTASILDQMNIDESDESDEEFTERKQKIKKKHAILTEDKTLDINTRAPESVGDFERLIMGDPNSSVIWMNYMAFQLQLSEIEKAREIGERALKTINFREEGEKLNIWIAMLNLENTFGTDETLDAVFKKACQYMDSYTIHIKTLGIYQMSEKFDKASDLYKITAKKFGSDNVQIWVLWGEFLIAKGKPDEARAILANALNSLPKRCHIDVVKKFAQLEYNKGDPERGRSLFEGLIADAPKRIDIWNVYIDQEIKADGKHKVEDLFERVTAKKLIKKQAKFFFNKWLKFEQAKEDEKFSEYVKAKASEYVSKHFKDA